MANDSEGSARVFRKIVTVPAAKEGDKIEVRETSGGLVVLLNGVETKDFTVDVRPAIGCDACGNDCCDGTECTESRESSWERWRRLEGE